eukprot:4752909-Pyramimonas_sp.AAC.1
MHPEAPKTLQEAPGAAKRHPKRPERLAKSFQTTYEKIRRGHSTNVLLDPSSPLSGESVGSAANRLQTAVPAATVSKAAAPADLYLLPTPACWWTWGNGH